MLGTIVKIKLDSTVYLTSGDEMVLAALQRSTNSLHDADLDTVKDYIHDLDAGQIPGVVNNVKGILHEIYYTDQLNDLDHDSDARMFENTNHPEYDVAVNDDQADTQRLIQLKATDDPAYVKDWLEDHPNGEIVVTDELAQKLDLQTSGVSNHELTVNVDHFMDKMLALPDNNALWQHFPALSAVSICIVIFGLLKRYRSGEISLSQFKKGAAAVAGQKILKIGVITVLMTIPVVNVITGTVLIARILLYVNKR